MSSLQVIRGNVVTPTEVLYHGYVVVDGDTILKVCPSDVPLPSGVLPENIVDVEHALVIPGFVDIHNHGLGGCDEVLEHWLHPEFSLRELARCGTLSTLASIIFSSKQKKAVQQVVECVESHVGKPLTGCAVIEGIHAEGPIVADYGGLPTADTDLSQEAFEALCATMPSMKVMTISPSCEARCNYERLKHLVKIGVKPSLGHDRKATESDVLGALRCAPSMPSSSSGPSSSLSSSSGVPSSSASSPTTAGASLDESRRRFHTTHFCNVMSFHHRDPSLVNFCLTPKFPRSNRYTGCTPPTLEIIADLIHVHPLSIQAVLASRSIHDIAIISDCISAYLPGKRLKYNGRQIAVRAEGGCYLCDSFGTPTTTLAGSTVTLADQFMTMVTYFGLDVVKACLVVATNPATIAGIHHRVGSLREGLKANLLIVEGNMTRITRRMVYGKWLDDATLKPYLMLKPTPAHI